MTEGVNDQAIAKPEKESALKEGVSDKEFNFRRLEAEREKEREARIRAEMQAEALQNEVKQIQEMLRPKEADPFDSIEDIADLDRDKLKKLFSHSQAQLERRAREIAETTIREEKERDKKTNFRDQLRRQYNDYDQFMNEQTIAQMQEREPDAIDAISAIEDPYVRCEKAYSFIKKRMSAKKEEVPPPSVKDKVEENMQNTYMIPASSSTPPYNAVDFDLRSPNARKAAYEKLKAAQRRPLGQGSASH